MAYHTHHLKVTVIDEVWDWYQTQAKNREMSLSGLVASEMYEHYHFRDEEEE